MRMLLGAKWLLVGNIFYAASQWLILMILAKLGDVEMVGHYTLALSMLAPLFMFSNLQLRAIQATDAKGEFAFSDFLFLRFLGGMFSMVACVAVGEWAGVDNKEVLYVIALSKGFESFSDIVHGALNVQDRTLEIARSLIFKGLISISSVWVVLAQGFGLFAAVAFMAIGWLGVLIFQDFRVIGFGLLKIRVISLEKLKKILMLSFPLAISVSLVSLQASIPRYFLNINEGVAAVGIYSALAYVIIIGSIFVNAIGQYISPRLAQYWVAADAQRFNALVFAGLSIAAGAGVLGVVASAIFGEWFLNVFYGPEYATQSQMMVLLMIGGGFLYMASILGYVLTATRALRQQVPIFVLVNIVTVIASMALIPRWGGFGASYVLIVSALTQLILMLYVYKKVMLRLA